MNRPITLKKDNIQTRNRKLAAKAKKQRKLGSSTMDFFNSSALAAAYTGAAAAGTAAGYLSGYYGCHQPGSYSGYPGLSLSPGSAAVAAYNPSFFGTAAGQAAAATAAGHSTAMPSMLTPA